jgi:hypothetical protein
MVNPNLLVNKLFVIPTLKQSSSVCLSCKCPWYIVCHDCNRTTCLLTRYGDVEFNGESAVNLLVDVVKDHNKPAVMDNYCLRYPTNGKQQRIRSYLIRD